MLNSLRACRSIWKPLSHSWYKNLLEALKIADFLKVQGPLYDVRSPLEYIHGTIPEALNLPLFTDEERKGVGTLYKQNPTAAFLLGLKFAGPKLSFFAEEGIKRNLEGIARIFCFRGGQRSGSMAWLFRSSGVKTVTLQGGYKAFRRFVLNTFCKSYNFQVIGGMSGSGKTDFLYQLKSEGKQVIDLEGLAQHKGSAFGLLGKPAQPSSEAFENALAYQLHLMNADEPIWIEDESRMIGSCKIPDPIYLQMKTASFHLLEVSKEKRLERLLVEYGCCHQDDLIAATLSLKKKLGELSTKKIITCIQNQELKEAASLLLEYYDKTYLYSMRKRNSSINFSMWHKWYEFSIPYQGI